MPNQYTTPNIAERFWTKVEFTDTCWLWTASIAKGYGQFSVGGHWVKAHRWAYEFCVGPIPDGFTIDHLCRNHPCVYPWHLEPVTNQVNILRGNGTAAINARKICCLRGHPLSGDNLYVKPPGKRVCKICRNAVERERRKAKAR